MKNLLIKLIIGAFIFMAMGSNESYANYEENTSVSQETKVTKIKNQNGFMVLDQKEQKNHSTVAVIVVDYDFDYLYAVNVFDVTDTIVLDRQSDFVQDDILLVTFEQDDIAKVERNTKVIENIVFGNSIVRSFFN